MTRKIAIPVFETRVSVRLDCAGSVLLVTMEDGRITRRREVSWDRGNQIARIRLLLDEGIQVLICDGLPDTCSGMLDDAGIEVIPWIRGEVDDVLRRYIHGTLQPTIQ